VKERPCFWAPDYAWLSLLKPQPGRGLRIGAAQQLALLDSADQTLAASTTANVTFNANTIVPGSWVPPAMNQAILFESLNATVVARDTSAKLQVNLMLAGSIGDGVSVPPTIVSVLGYPTAFPTIVALGVRQVCVPPIVLLLPRPAPAANGPSFVFVIQNTDGAGAHTYRRAFNATFRIIDNCDFSSGPTIPGAGISPEYDTG